MVPFVPCKALVGRGHIGARPNAMHLCKAHRPGSGGNDNFLRQEGPLFLDHPHGLKGCPQTHHVLQLEYSAMLAVVTIMLTDTGCPRPSNTSQCPLTSGNTIHAICESVLQTHKEHERNYRCGGTLSGPADLFCGAWRHPRNSPHIGSLVSHGLLLMCLRIRSLHSWGHNWGPQQSGSARAVCPQ